MHGGLSPDLNSMEQIRRVMRPTDVSNLVFHYHFWHQWLSWVQEMWHGKKACQIPCQISFG
jgi:hypothetical protein